MRESLLKESVNYYLSLKKKVKWWKNVRFRIFGWNKVLLSEKQTLYINNENKRGSISSIKETVKNKSVSFNFC